MKKSSLILSITVIGTALFFSSFVDAAKISRSTANILKFQIRLAEKGNHQAQYKLASMYEFGVGTEKNLSTARDWYKRASDGGSVEASDRLTYMDIRKNGFDKKAHIAWLNKIKTGAESGDQHAAMILGQMYSYGLGVKKDLDESIRLLNLAGVYENPVVVYEIERVEKEKSWLSRQSHRQEEEELKEQRELKASKMRIKEAKASSKPTPVVLSKVEIAAQVKAEKRRRYEEVMRKLKEEERIIEEQQAWAEGKR